MNEYFTYYAESNLVCIVIFSILLLHDYFNVDRQEKQIKFDHSLIAFMLYFLSDSVWAAIIAGIFPYNKTTVLVTNTANFILMSMLSYMWLRYVLAAEQTPNRERPLNRFLMVFPFLLTALLMVVVYFVAPKLLLGQDLTLQPLYFFCLITVPAVYVIAVLIYTLRRMHREENPLEKRKHFAIGVFPLLVVIGGLLQTILLSQVPIFCFCCTILMLIYYIRSMETQISLDPLTELNNRSQLMRYVSLKSNLYREGRLTYVIMLDVNDFKSINDKYGHAEGDRALIITAKSLQRTVNKNNAPVFLGRYGGDEFILIAHPNAEGEIEPLLAELRAEVEAACRAEGTPYLISVSIGYDCLTAPPDSIQKCIQRADMKMYLDKEYCKLHGRSTVCR